MSALRWLLIFCGIHLSLAGILFVNVPDEESRLEKDSGVYVNKALNFEKHGSFISPKSIKNGPSLYPPGYSIFMVFVRSVLGKSHIAVVFAQIFLILCMIFLVFSLSFYFFSRNVSLLAAFLASINVGYLVYPQFILTETLLGFLLLLGFERFIAYYFNRNVFSLILSALCYGCSIIVKSAAIYYVPFLILLLIFLIGGKKGIGAAVLYSFIFLIPVGQYVLTNKKLYGHYYLKAIDRVNLYYYFFPKILEETEGTGYNEACDKIHSLSEVKEFGSGKGWEKVHAFFLEKVSKHPFLAVKIWAFNVMKTFLGLYTNHLKVLLYKDIKYTGYCSFFKFTGNIFQRFWGYVTYGIGSIFIIAIAFFETFLMMLRYIAVFFALCFLLINRKLTMLILFTSYIAYFALITGHDGCARFRVLFEAPLMVFSAVGFFVIYNVLFKKSRKCAVLQAT